MANRSARSPAAAAKRAVDEERVEIDEETIRDLREALAEVDRGETVDARAFLARLRAADKKPKKKT